MTSIPIAAYFVEVPTPTGFKRRCLGKLLSLPDGRIVLWRAYPWKKSYHRVENSLSIDTSVSQIAEYYPNAEVHCEFNYGKVHVVKLSDLIHQPVKNFGEGNQFYMPVTYWKVQERDYDIHWVVKEIKL